MTEPMIITLKAMVDRSEQAAVTQAATLLESSLTTAGTPVIVKCQFENNPEALKGKGEASVLIASLLPEVCNHAQPWTTVEERLSESFRNFANVDSASPTAAFICTVFRCVPTDESDSQSRLIRIRRLNLLAAELSRQSGHYVIDLDRCLADAGALKIQTDYRLEGPFAARVVAKEMALAIVSAGLDAVVPFEVQDAAKLIINEADLALPVSKNLGMDALPSNVLALRAGGLRQVVATVVDTDAEGHVGWLFRLLLSGRLSPKEAVAKLANSVSSRGLRASSSMVFAAARQILLRRTRTGR
jgi:hypothetical protein